MKNKFWFLTNYTFGRIKKPLLLIAGLMVLVEATTLFITAGSKEFYFEPYENILNVALIPFVFAFSILTLIIVLMKKFHSFYSKQRGIYSLFTLPIKRIYILFSNIFVALSAVLFLVAIQLIFAAILYFPTEAIANAVSQTIKFNSNGVPTGYFRVYMDNGLFLAFIRNNFLRALLPVDFQGTVILISFILTSSIVPSYSFLTNFDGSIKLWATVDLALMIVNVSILYVYGCVNEFGFGFAFVPVIFLLLLDIFWIMSVLNQYKKSTMLYRGAK